MSLKFEVNDGRGFFSLTHPQKRVWYIEKIHPDTSVGIIGGTARIRGAVNCELLQESIKFLIKSNEAIRLQFTEMNSKIFQYVEDYEDRDLEYYDFSRSDNPESDLEKWAINEFRKPFSMTNSKLYYFALFKVNDNDYGYFVKFHHIICDGWSINLMTEQICDVYLKLLQGEKNGIAIKESYIDYIKKEQDYLNSDRFKKNRDFWNNKFKDLHNHLNSLSSPSLKGSRKTYKLGQSFSIRIKEFAEQNKFSINTFFVSLVILYISKITSQKDIIIGTPVLNRSGKKEKSTFGMFTSTMPLRFCIDSSFRIVDMVKAVNSELASCYFNQKFPYDLLVQDLQLNKRGYQNLFQISVNYYNTRPDTELGGFPVENAELYNGNQIYSLQLVVKEWSDSSGLTLDFDYKLDDYTKEQIEEMYKCFMRLTENILKYPETPLSRLTLLSDEEKNELIYDFNSSQEDYPRNRTIDQLFEEQVGKTPDNIAISFNNTDLTYKELNEKSNQTAHFLRRMGVKKGNIVGLMVSHSLEMVVGIMAIIKAGGAYLPIDPEYPPERINYMLDDSGASLLLTNCMIGKEIMFSGCIARLDDNGIGFESGSNLEIQNHCNDVVYIIYTSGSTGGPKGVIIEHQGLVNYIWWAKKMYIRDVEDVFALFTSLSFDLTVTSIFTPLINGNKIAVYGQDEHKHVLYRIMSENKVNIVKLTPSHLSLIKDLDNSNSSVKRFIVGGEDLKVKLAQSVYKSFNGDIEIYNEYGPTETVVGCMINKYNPEKDRRTSVPIGVPADNVQIYILDEDLNPVPKGKTGEIYISGDGVARGYLNKIDLTGERFVINPYIKDKRMYRTGDLARHLEHGVIEYVGRGDHQVKIRGYRIELGEIEKYLLSYDSILRAVVIDHQSEDSSKYLCAYVVSTRDISETEVRKYLTRYLPDYMIPVHIIKLDEIPLTSNGKVDRALLKPPAKNIGNLEYKAPINESDIKLIEAIKSVLGIEDIGMSHSFFSIGGDSIKAIQIASVLNETGLKISVKDILSHPVLEEMAACIETDYIQDAADQGICEGVVGETPVSCWFFSQNFKKISHYNQSVLLELRQEINTARLENAFEQLVGHHDALRINIKPGERTMFYNNLHLMNSIRIKEFNLSIYPYEKQLEMMREIGEEYKSSFDITEELLIKACIFNLGKAGKRMLITAHHLVVDGISWRIIIEDLQRMLKEDSDYHGDILPLKTHSMQKWADVLKEYVQGEVKKEAEYWNSILRNDFTFPVDYFPSERTSEKIGTIVRQISDSLTEKLLKRANIAYGTESIDILIASLAMAISKFTGEEDILIELEGHGRQLPLSNIDISRTVGWFTSLYPVELNVLENSVEGTIKSVKEQLRKVPNKGIGFGILKYLSGSLEKDFERKYVRFNYMGDFNNTFDSSFFSFTSEESGSDISRDNHMNCLIEIDAIIVNRMLEIRVNYSRNYFEEETVVDFTKMYLNQLSLMIEHCCNKDAREFTPSDFDGVDILQSDLDGLFS